RRRGEEAASDLLVVARNTVGLELLERVRERVVPDVVQQRRVRHQLLALPDLRRYAAAITERPQRLAGEMVDAERVIEAGVRRAGVDEVRPAELADVAEPLELRGVDDPDRRGVEAYRVPERIPDDRAGRCGLHA